MLVSFLHWTLTTFFLLLNIDISTQNSLTTRFSYPSHLLFQSKSNEIPFQIDEKITISNEQILFSFTRHTQWIEFFSLLLCCRLSHSRNTKIFLRNWTELAVCESVSVYFFPSANQHNYLLRVCVCVCIEYMCCCCCCVLMVCCCSWSVLWKHINTHCQCDLHIHTIKQLHSHLHLHTRHLADFHVSSICVRVCIGGWCVV